MLVLGGAPRARAQAYKDPGLPVDSRVRDLLSRMTLEEKFWQLFMLSTPLEGTIERCEQGAFGFQISSSGDSACSASYVNSVQRRFVEGTRLGIPIIPFDEAVHGLVLPGATVFPQAIALAATFDVRLMEAVSAAIAHECRSRGIRQVLSPVVNVATDARWGRVEETYGEDPYLASEMGAAFVSHLEMDSVITTPKHFVANVGDGGRDSYPIALGERALREIHFPPFASCIRRGGSRSVMMAYNSVDGAPCTANEWLMKRILKEELGLGGFVVSDAGAVGGANVLHFTATDYAEATARAMNAGLDVIFQTSFDHHPLFMRAFEEGMIDSATIDAAVARVLRAKLELGLFERPYVDTAASLLFDSGSAGRIAEQAALESIVLLRNEGNTLPLSKSLERIAVIGADAREARLGGYSGRGKGRLSIFDAVFVRALRSADVRYARGCGRGARALVTIPAECLLPPEGVSDRHGLLGEYFNNIRFEGDPALTRIDPQIRFGWTLYSPDPARLAADFYSVRWTGRLKAPATGKFAIGVDGSDGYRLYVDGALAIDHWRRPGRRIMTVERRLEKGREYDIRLEYAEPVGSGCVELLWSVDAPRDEEAGIAEAVKLARRSDVAIVVAGIEEGEFRDRARLSLPGRQEELIERVAATGTPVVVVLVGGSAITMTRWLDRVSAILDVWYPGERGGAAVADVLFGDYNPAGRVPITFPIEEGQLPLVYNHKPTGRGDDYVDLTGEPLFPFGYGLSYTTFEYEGLTFDRERISRSDTTVVRVRVTNTGARAGDEVVQLYVRDEVSSVARPVMELKGFKRVGLDAGETREVRFTITPSMLSMLDANLDPVVEPGTFRVMIGSSSKDIRARGILTVVR